MSNIEFEENKAEASILYARFEKSKNEPRIVSWLIKKGVVKSETPANIILILFILVMLGLSAYFIFFFNKSGSTTFTAEQVQKSFELKNRLKINR